MSGADVQVKERAAVLLRILLLVPVENGASDAPNPKVSVDTAAAAMNIAKSGFGRYAQQLRKAFGTQDAIDRTNGYVQFVGDRSETDAAVIEDKYAQIEQCVDASGVIEAVQAEKILPTLIEIENLYKGSPAMGFGELEWADKSEEQRKWFQALETVADRWLERWSSIQLLHADCEMLLHPSKSTGTDWVTKLLKIARTPAPDEEVWIRLLKAAQMSQSPSDHNRAWEEVSDYYARVDRDIPEDLTELAPPRLAHSETDARALHKPQSSVNQPGFHREGLNHLYEITRLLGITTASAMQLRGAEVEPLECISRTNKRLFFSGVLASKWVVDRGVRHEFEELLSRLDSADAAPEEADVRFLIIKPHGSAYNTLFQMRGGRLSADSIPHLKALDAKYQSFQVRVVDALPAFRIVAIDDEFVSFSTYALEGERYATSKHGWDAPHVLLDPRAPYPLAEAFRLYFEERWAGATPIQDIKG